MPLKFYNHYPTEYLSAGREEWPGFKVSKDWFAILLENALSNANKSFSHFKVINKCTMIRLIESNLFGNTAPPKFNK